MESNNDDKQTIRRALGGDDMAWTLLVEKYRVYSYRLAWRITLHEDDALDAVQETMTKMAAGLHKFRGENSLRSWITTIAIREATNVCRRRARSPLVMDPDEVSGMADDALQANTGAPHPADKLDEQRQLARVQEAMIQLSPQQRAILLLAINNDIGPAEIAKELSLPANQVRSQQARAIKLLRNLLNPSPHDDHIDQPPGAADTKETNHEPRK